ncbi:hypothetical protein [Aminobacter sp. BE322]|uniref:hypothetical protein n=1 Tax=unclassified Aminobacter TaxID=2644704 RepID=UPI003D1D96BC
MKFSSLPLVVALVLGALPATAAPMPLPVATPGLVVNVGGCHRDVRDGYVEEIGRRAAHYHLPETCRPVLVEVDRLPRRQPVDCHRDVRIHRIEGLMLRHRHVGDDCRVREVRRATEFLPN